MFLRQMRALLKHVQLCRHAHVSCVSSIFVKLCVLTVFVPQLYTWVTISGRLSQDVLTVFNISYFYVT